MNLTKQEKIYYTILICFSMEFIMVFYNRFFHTDAFLDEAFMLACLEFIPAFIVGVICEWFIISKLAKRIAYYLHNKHLKNRNIIRINEFFIAVGMMLVIAVYGALLHSNSDTNLIILIGIDFIKNAIFGIPLFMLLVSPLSRKIIHLFSGK